MYSIDKSDISKFSGHEFNGAWVFFETFESGPVLCIWFVRGSAFGTFSRQLLKLHKSGKIEISEQIEGPFVIEHEKAPNQSLNRTQPQAAASSFDLSDSRSPLIGSARGSAG